MKDLHTQILRLRARRLERRQRHESVASIDAKLVVLVAKQIRKELRAERRRRAA